MRLRFAPSPTGYLHIGGARTALYNYLLARHSGGSFILRIDDTDCQRSKPEYENDIKDCLNWLNIKYDEGPDIGGNFGPYRQSERKALYYDYAEKLLAMGRAIKDRDGAVYLRYPDSDIVVEDLICGNCHFQSGSLGPAPVLIRTDGEPTYHLASVVDDIEMGITHIVRGQDHLTNSAKHLGMFAALSKTLPKFAHLPLLLGDDGGKLSKRATEGLVSVKDFREKGYLPEAVVNYLLLLGWSHPEGKEHLSIEDAIKVFEIERIGKTGSRFEISRLDWLNSKWIKNLPAKRLADDCLSFCSEYKDIIEQKGFGFWTNILDSLRPDISLLSQSKQIADFIFALEIPLSAEAQEFLSSEDNHNAAIWAIRSFLESVSDIELEEGRDSLSKEQFTKVINRLKKNKQIDNKQMFHSLRAAITGALSGPELKVLIPFINREVLTERLSAALHKFRHPDLSLK